MCVDSLPLMIHRVMKFIRFKLRFHILNEHWVPLPHGSPLAYLLYQPVLNIPGNP